ncbi:MAG: hypothetical protein ABJE10_17790 [bacterium]
MKEAKFNPTGGPIQVSVKCEPNRNGSYTIFLWEAEKNQIVKEFSGNFINSDDDTYELSTPNGDHAGRLVEAMVVVAIPAGLGPSDVTLSITQDGAELQHDGASVPPGSPGQLVDVFIKLVSK